MTQAAPADTGPVAGSLLQITPQIRASMSPEILATLPAEMIAPEDDGHEPPVGDAEAALEPEEAPDEAPEESDEVDPEVAASVQLAEYVSLYEKNPKSITSVPRALQPQVAAAHREWLEQATQAAVNEAYRKGIAEGQQGVQIRQQVETLDKLFEDGDVFAFKEMVAKFPGGERGYHAAKANLAPVQAGSTDDYQRRATEIFHGLEREFPEAAAKVRASWNYAATDTDIERLRQDVADARAEAKLARLRTDPNTKQLNERSQAAAQRKALPKPDVSPPGAASAGSPPTLAEAKAWSPQQWQAYEKRVGPEAFRKFVSGLK